MPEKRRIPSTEGSAGYELMAETTHHNDADEGLFSLCPGCPMPYLRYEYTKQN